MINQKKTEISIHKKRFAKFSFVVIFLLLAVIAVAFGRGDSSSDSPAATPSPVLPDSQTLKTSDQWKTYRNEEYGYEVQYPKSWVYNALDNRQGRTILFSDAPILIGPMGSIQSTFLISINVDINAAVTSIDKWVADLLDEEKKDEFGLRLKSKEPIDTDHSKGLKVEYIGNTPYPILDTYFYACGKMFTIETEDRPENRVVPLIYDRMIRSFNARPC